MADNSAILRFSWLKHPVDLRKDCIMCALAENSPCEKQLDLYKQSVGEEPKEVTDKKFEKFFSCVESHPEIFKPRNEEYFRKIAQFNK